MGPAIKDAEAFASMNIEIKQTSSLQSTFLHKNLEGQNYRTTSFDVEKRNLFPRLRNTYVTWTRERISGAGASPSVKPS